ncbi:hypothetical protein KIF53_01190 [Chromobacterium subtsugae]|uniref:DegT/DnrJ/EryC1/StrS aminotransferase n=1 Tax=Chromobacterium subtsugae TaxID=251747 RepID=A0ABS7F843_9NEIS|nr:MULTISPECIES: hypothetical protein [Chromobacterium]KUM04293.1 degT/DnrJ/EryC1/StrS aminotransferase [Chromobacterium subtsugae]KZE83303.1 degT/DnrJ/EryC1/StrS aminotransferase [Chromobacterium sp. F49]MBW7565222.1 hypothetical protein [Chromobacterium subtsugae]MBW8286250.1 hypothetical protein [Chromobacterium subtsugae]OBU87855.1 degT/DnrJ/EryC1/StrS aminotransferase family protein [Chromobacterium subtsugae]
MNNFQQSLILSRVMTSGVVMSIEKNDRQLPGLESLIRSRTGLQHVALFNSITGAIHGALHGQGIGHGGRAVFPGISEREYKFLTWLGVTFEETRAEPRTYGLASVAWRDEQTDFAAAATRLADDKVQVYDFAALGFGPCAAIATNDEQVWKRAERLKIFGAFDLRTMWSQAESEPDIQPTIQFNYRLSPLVAACVRQAIQGD